MIYRAAKYGAIVVVTSGGYDWQIFQNLENTKYDHPNKCIISSEFERFN